MDTHTQKSAMCTNHPVQPQLGTRNVRLDIHCAMAMANLGVPSRRIVHLGELCRWLFLFNTRSPEEFWLRSNYMCAWIVGSVVVALYMPIVAGVGCSDVMEVSFNLPYR